MSRKLEPYHYAWLSDNSSMDVFELMTLLKRGFDIHHLDGDHGNNDPFNLVLIWGADHMMLHNGKKRMTRNPHHSAKRIKKLKKKLKNKEYDCGCLLINEVFFPCSGSEPLPLRQGSKPNRMMAEQHKVLK
jgi:hypothetical protein